jgi:hypothetical protein
MSRRKTWPPAPPAPKREEVHTPYFDFDYNKGEDNKEVPKGPKSYVPDFTDFKPGYIEAIEEIKRKSLEQKEKDAAEQKQKEDKYKFPEPIPRPEDDMINVTYDAIPEGAREIKWENVGTEFKGIFLGIAKNPQYKRSYVGIGMTEEGEEVWFTLPSNLKKTFKWYREQRELHIKYVRMLGTAKRFRFLRDNPI